MEIEKISNEELLSIYKMLSEYLASLEKIKGGVSND
jgi:hypothetical protein